MYKIWRIHIVSVWFSIIAALAIPAGQPPGPPVSAAQGMPPGNAPVSPDPMTLTITICAYTQPCVIYAHFSENFQPPMLAFVE